MWWIILCRYEHVKRKLFSNCLGIEDVMMINLILWKFISDRNWIVCNDQTHGQSSDNRSHANAFRQWIVDEKNQLVDVDLVFTLRLRCVGYVCVEMLHLLLRRVPTPLPTGRSTTAQIVSPIWFLLYILIFCCRQQIMAVVSQQSRIFTFNPPIFCWLRPTQKENE